jgi:hypothetical protein
MALRSAAPVGLILTHQWPQELVSCASYFRRNWTLRIYSYNDLRWRGQELCFGKRVRQPSSAMASIPSYGGSASRVAT